MKYDRYKSNEYSQFGEDGILKKAAADAGIYSGRCLDIGAADGVWYSNVLSFIEKGFSAVLVESGRDRFDAMAENMEKRGCADRVECLHMSAEPGNAPDIAARAGEVEVMSLDIDGGEDEIWSALGPIAKLAVVEWKHRGNDNTAGLDKVAGELGYTKVAATNCNYVYVRNDVLENIGR